MVVFVDTVAGSKQENGYVDCGRYGALIATQLAGFRKYMQDHGYKVASIYLAESVTNQELKNRKSYQQEFATALGSLKYYPRTQMNDYIRSCYAKSSPLNMDFTFPDNKPGDMY